MKKNPGLPLKQMQVLRNDGISCEIFYENAKMDKQFKYASKKNIPFAVIIGSNELEQKTCVVKDFKRVNRKLFQFKIFLHILKNKQVTLFEI